MPTTPNLLLLHVEEGQQSREVTIDEALDGLDGALAGHDAANFDFPSNDNYTPTPADCRANLSFEVVSTFGSLTVTRELIVPDDSKLYLILNSTTGGQAITVKTSGGTGVMTSTGTTNVVLSGSPTIVTPTIASFANATHDHTNAAGGGTLEI